MANERLPSFVELMASLGLQNADSDHRVHPSAHSPSFATDGRASATANGSFSSLYSRSHSHLHSLSLSHSHSHTPSLSSTASSLASIRGQAIDSAPVTPASPDPMYQQHQQQSFLQQQHQHQHQLQHHSSTQRPHHTTKKPAHGATFPPGAFQTQQMSKLYHRAGSESESDQDSSTGSERSRRKSGGSNRLARYAPYQPPSQSVSSALPIFSTTGC